MIEFVHLSLPHWPSTAPALRHLWQSVAPRCSEPDCPRNRTVWARIRRKHRAVWLRSGRYCVDGCLDRAVRRIVLREGTSYDRGTPAHRIPLGLLLLSRHQLSVEQLRTALAAQRAAGHGRIGEWLQMLGYAGEQEVTAALARQWSCPVLHHHSLDAGAGRSPKIPLTLLRSVSMAPVDFVTPTRTLHVAFSDGLDYNVLYGLERMLGCRTEPCLAVPSLLQRYLQNLPERREQTEVVFNCLGDIAELVRIVRSYIGRLDPAEVRIVRCGSHLWVRLLRGCLPMLDLVLKSFWESAPSARPETAV